MDDSHDLVVRTIREHAGALLRTARRHSLCADDAHDAYQRALEIFLRRASSLEPDTVDRWLHVVVKHEAQAVRRTRQQLVASDEVDLDGRPCDAAPDADERLMRFDRLSRSAEALQRLKPQEVTALWLKAQGLSYTEIAERQSWTYTKVNRCITEGRRAFLERYAGIETGEECRRWSPVLSALVDGEATAEQLAAARPHLRRCSACKATLRELHAAGPRMAGVLPAPGPGLGLGLAGAGASGAGVVGMAGVAAGGAGGGRLETLVRGVESAATGLQERMAGWAVKVQMAGDVAAGGKVAAVAASAAALAGGGAVTIHHVRADRPSAVESAAAAPGPDQGPKSAPARLISGAAGSVVALRPAPGAERAGGRGPAGVAPASDRAGRGGGSPTAGEFGRGRRVVGRGRGFGEFRVTSGSPRAPVVEFRAARAVGRAAGVSEFRVARAPASSATSVLSTRSDPSGASSPTGPATTSTPTPSRGGEFASAAPGGGSGLVERGGSGRGEFGG